MLMGRRWNDAEIEQALKSIVVLVDTREKQWGHIRAALEENRLPFISRKLDFGDYSYQYTDPEGSVVDMSPHIAVERKASLDEICGNFTYGRARFAREFDRSRGAEVHLLLEDASWWKIETHEYMSRLHPEALLGNLFSWCARYGIRLWFCPTAFSGKFLQKLFWYHLRDTLQKEEGENIGGIS